MLRLLLNGQCRRYLCSKQCNGKSLILGCFQTDGSGIEFTDAGKQVDNRLAGTITKLLHKSKFKPELGKTRTFYSLHSDDGASYGSVTLTGLGERDARIDENEVLDIARENVRQAIGAAVKQVSEISSKIDVDGCEQPEAAGEAASLASYAFNKFKSSEAKPSTSVSLLQTNINDDFDWSTGLLMGRAQNYARDLMNTPANHKYPHALAERVANELGELENVSVIIRDEDWALEQKMGCFLSVGHGSEQPSRFLEVHYNGCQEDERPVVLVGKGVTFDSGGISIKPSAGMALMKGDMGGAACVLAAIKCAAEMKLQSRIIALVPLVENMPSGRATRPGDVFTARNGTTVEVDNTDAEGRMILADALSYADDFSPRALIDVATLTGAIDVALGGGAAGAFTPCRELWGKLEEAGARSGDRLWRMPLFKHYTKQMKCSDTADLRNTQKKARSAGSSTAAAFLKEFTTTANWAHLDIAGVMDASADASYLGKGMTGRPTRTIIEYLRNQQHSQR